MINSEQYQLLGKFNISLSSLRDQSIHKRYYKVFDGNKMVCEVLLNLLYIYDQVLMIYFIIK